MISALPFSRRMVAQNLGTLVPAALFVVLCFGTIRTLATGLWQAEDHAYSPIILVIAVLMSAVIVRRRQAERPEYGNPSNFGFAVMIACGAAILIGYLLNNIFLRSIGLLGMAGGLVLAMSGWATLRRLALPFLISLFAIPLPGSLITAITFPLKMSISAIATAFLKLIGLPVSSEGVVMDVGNYRLLVADACSGLQSMFSLLAVAIVYVFLAGITQPSRTALLLACSVPIVFILNIGRVVVLALITYFFGNGVGEGFVHGVAGMAMFVLAFFGLMAVDRIVERLWPTARA